MGVFQLKLRDYQKDVIQKTIGSNKDTLIQIPTGGGKTLIAKEIAVELVAKKNMQVLFVAPKIVLMEQTAKVFKTLKPHIVHRDRQYDHKHHVLISTIQTASRREDLRPDVIIIDEIHYGFEGKMIETLMKAKSGARIIGLSATPYDKYGRQLKGFGLILDQYDLKYMVNHEDEYLVKPEVHVLTRVQNLDSISIVAGEYNLSQLSKIVCNNQTILEIVKSTAEFIEKNKKAIVFAVDINHSELLAKAYRKAGFASKALHSNMHRDEINFEIRQFRQGSTKVLVSVLMLTTGFDVPDTDLAVIARPTKSQNLYKQMIGRILRPAEGKTHAVLLDCGNVIENLGMPLDPIREVDAAENSGKQTCQNCGSEKIKLKKEAKKSYWECQECGHRKKIEHGAYKCKLCNTIYTHDAKFEQKNDKLYLVCDKCPYPTLISEYHGNEKFVKIKDKEIKYLPFNEAREYVRSLKLESKKEWRSLIRKDAKENNKLIPENIPRNPHDIYQNNGWVNIEDWIGIKADDYGYLPYEDAHSFVLLLGLNSLDEWTKYRQNKLDGYEIKPKKIPDRPQEVYKKEGWEGFDVWLGLDRKKTEKIDRVYQAIQSDDIDAIANTIDMYDKAGENEVYQILASSLNDKSLLKLLEKFKSKLVKTLNPCIENNRYEVIKQIFENIDQYDYWYIDDDSIRKLIDRFEGANYSLLRLLAQKKKNEILQIALVNGNTALIDMILEFSIGLEEFYEEDENNRLLRKLLNHAPEQWKSFEIDNVMDNLDEFYFEDIEELFYFDLESFDDLIKILNQYDIVIKYTGPQKHVKNLLISLFLHEKGVLEQIRENYPKIPSGFIYDDTLKFILEQNGREIIESCLESTPLCFKKNGHK
jgi:superfamily II DNA or RNA helicase